MLIVLLLLCVDDANAEATRSSLPDEVIAEGTSLVEAFLSDWASRTSASSTGDVEMTGEGEDEERELVELKKVYEEWKDRLEGSQWVREVLSKTA